MQLELTVRGRTARDEVDAARARIAAVEAIADLIALAHEFHPFRHLRTGLRFPPRSVLADERDIVPEPSRYTSPLGFDAALAEMDVLAHRFLYFVDRADAEGKVLYLGGDGAYGLVTAT
jgi:hypothetical protein